MRTKATDVVMGVLRMWLSASADRARSLHRGDHGDAPPEVLVTGSIVGALAAVTMWLMSLSASRYGFMRWGALVMGLLAVVVIGGYVLIKAQEAIDAARWRRAHETGE